ncbi:hypothetical protein ACH4OW_38970 [Streptomyces sp. NPDC017056]|uniref:hypothetical protein n=1 Tax=Streptomyces sp. NPDC017056 TaxID=3364973 RepID=UPI0037977C0D
MPKTWLVSTVFFLSALLAAAAVAAFTIGDMQAGVVAGTGAILAAGGGVYAAKKEARILTAKQNVPVLLAVVVSINLDQVLDRNGDSFLVAVSAAVAVGLVVGLIARIQTSGK